MQVWRLLTYSFCHKRAPSLFCSAALLIVLGQCQERPWGTVRFLAGRNKRLGLMLAGEGEGLAVFRPLQRNFFMLSETRDQLPLTSTARRPQLSPEPAPFNRPHWSIYHTPPAPWRSAAFEWTAERALAASESLLLEEELLRAGILASLQESSEESPNNKLEVPKSSVSSLRLQQLERMGFPTEKAVVVLSASGRLKGAISLLIDSQVGEEAVVTTRGKANSIPEACLSCYTAELQGWEGCEKL
ncbi:rhomboid domain-containing protein 3-like [Polyodon spathula]|uniref:rhomboid domain-containing protein 3-like n=1 Tax=Polyodon spathula TaxID=7913 RepID=UPI001B7E4F31|nr:rhomboid domain-containing protein 3-like [Polyodon spathula]